MKTKSELREDLELRCRRYLPPNRSDADGLKDIHVHAYALGMALIRICVTGRELSLALTKIEEAMFWGNAAVARYGVDKSECISAAPPAASAPEEAPEADGRFAEGTE